MAANALRSVIRMASQDESVRVAVGKGVAVGRGVAVGVGVIVGVGSGAGMAAGPGLAVGLILSAAGAGVDQSAVGNTDWSSGSQARRATGTASARRRLRMVSHLVIREISFTPDLINQVWRRLSAPRPVADDVPHEQRQRNYRSRDGHHQASLQVLKVHRSTFVL